MKFLFGLIMGSFSCILGYTATPIAPAVVLETGINADQMQMVHQLLDITGVQCEKTLPSIVEATQKAWLRPAGKERWEMEEKLDLATQAKIVDICSQMGLFSEVYPQKRHYHYCLIMGAALPTVQKRIQYAEHLWLLGVRFDELVFLTGERTLDDRVDHLPLLPTPPENEAQGMLKVFESMSLSLDFKNLPLTIVNVPKQLSNRPNTADTVRCWLKMHPLPSRCLFISNQPYVIYQKAVVGHLIPKSFSFEVVGPSAGQSYYLRASLLLDNLARWLHQESQQ